MRRRAFAASLRAALRRWAAFGAVLVLVAGAGSNDPLGAAASLPVVLLWPLVQALQALGGGPAFLAAGTGWLAEPIGGPLQGGLVLLAWIALSATAGLVPLWLTRRWWWPPRWAEVERALPLQPADLRRSDGRTATLLVLPWHALLGVGLIVMASASAGAGAGAGAGSSASASASFSANAGPGASAGAPHAGIKAGADLGAAAVAAPGSPQGAALLAAAVLCWAVAAAGSIGLGRAWVHGLRQRAGPGHRAAPLPLAPRAWVHRLRSRPSDAGPDPTRTRPPAPQRPAPAPGASIPPARMPARWQLRWKLWWWLWWWLPLRRGAARGTARLLLLSGLATPALAAGPVAAPETTGWWLAALALAALASTSLLRARIAIEWAPWREAAGPWPLSPAQLVAQGRAIALLPVLLGALAMALALAVLAVKASTAGAASPRGAVALAYGLCLVGGCWMEARPPSAEAAHQAARWLFILALTVALGTEVMP